MMRAHYRLAGFLLTVALAVGVGSPRLTALGQAGQVGGGTLSGDPMGSSELVFRRPENPPLHTGTGAGPTSAGGGRLSSGERTRAEPRRRPTNT